MKSILIVLWVILPMMTWSQLQGKIVGFKEGKEEPIYGAKVRLLQANTGVISSEEGDFELNLPKQLPDTVVFSARGFHPDTMIVTKQDRFQTVKVILYSDLLLDEVLVSVRKDSRSISRLKTRLVETISTDELQKAACCNLSESFETNASVDVNFTDAVSGARRIQLMGLDGVYSQLQVENIPYLRGLGSAYGLNSISGTWIESIQVSKGPGSVVNGHESMTGLINIEMKKPDSEEKLFVNGYSSIYGREELNVNGNVQLNEKWSTGYLVHGSQMFGNIDRNKDGFKDIPQGMNVSALNRYKYFGKKFRSQFALHYAGEEKFGGQMANKKGSSDPSVYGVNLKSNYIDFFAKTGFLFEGKPYQSIGVIYNAKYQYNNALFGNRQYIGEEKRGYINAIYNGIIGNTDHGIKAGLGAYVVDYKQSLSFLSENDDRYEFVPGAFFEYTWTTNRLSLVPGVRYDQHNLFGGFTSPRVHIKYKLTENLDLRLSSGRGWRVPNYMIDNLSLLATSKNWIIQDNTQPEISWNYGGSLVKNGRILGKKTTFVLDYYYTEFTSQLMVDRTSVDGAFVFFNNEGLSYSNAVQFEFDMDLSKTFDLRVAYKFLDVKTTLSDDRLISRAMVPRNRGLINVAYKSRNKKWLIDFTPTYIGEGRLPRSLDGNGNLLSSTSEAYVLVSGQVTYNRKRLSFYLGGENLGDYKQNNVIIDAENPFGNTFDATRVWAPVMGINVYAGFRFKIEHKNKEK